MEWDSDSHRLSGRKAPGTAEVVHLEIQVIHLMVVQTIHTYAFVQVDHSFRWWISVIMQTLRHIQCSKTWNMTKSFLARVGLRPLHLCRIIFFIPKNSVSMPIKRSILEKKTSGKMSFTRCFSQEMKRNTLAVNVWERNSTMALIFSSNQAETIPIFQKKQPVISDSQSATTPARRGWPVQRKISHKHEEQ